MCPQSIGRPSFYFSAWGAGSGQASSRPQPLWYFRARSTWTGHRHNTYITLHRHVTSRCSRHVPSRHVTSLHVSSRLVPLPGSRFEVPLYIMSRHVTSRSQVPVSRYLFSRTFLGRAPILGHPRSARRGPGACTRYLISVYNCQPKKCPALLYPSWEQTLKAHVKRHIYFILHLIFKSSPLCCTWRRCLAATSWASARSRC